MAPKKRKRKMKTIKQKLKTFYKARGNLIKQLREKHGLTQQEIGAPSQIRRLEKGVVSNDNVIDTLTRLHPCPSEILCFAHALIKVIAPVCRNCKSRCKYKIYDISTIHKELFDEISVNMEN